MEAVANFILAFHYRKCLAVCLFLNTTCAEPHLKRKHLHHAHAFSFLWSVRMCHPEGCVAPGSVPCQCNTRGLLSKLEETPPQTKINVTSKSPVGDTSVGTLIRTDTTLDHSQKAEKVCWTLSVEVCAFVPSLLHAVSPTFALSSAPGAKHCAAEVSPQSALFH